MKLLPVAMAAFVLFAAGCEQGADDNGPAPFASRYEGLTAQTTLIKGATILTGTGERLDNADLLLVDGKVAAVGSGLSADGAEQVDAAGKWITPGVIDVHSHLGVYPSPGTQSHSDGNESTAPVTAQVWAEHSVWPNDPGFTTALAGGVTAMQILPGSANLFGGRGVTLKNVPGRNVMDMKFPGAPHGLKMACGENPKRNYGGRGQAPATRMGNVAGYRAAWIDAAEYRDKIKAAGKGQGQAPKRDLNLETLMGVLEGEIIIHNHCYRADEMSVMLDIAKEFGYKVGTFHHAVEAYKIADLLAEADTCAAVWADWWGFKMEAYDGIRENAAILDKAGACAVIHSDSAIGIQRLNQETAKIMGAAARVGMDITPEHAITWITSNAAKSLGVEDQTGSLEVGKMGDVVIWDGNPFSVYTRAERVYIDGALAYERDNDALNPVTDFSLGTAAAAGGAQ
ncbi:MAG: amidohydrolase [Gammaproteobacteria bacterium]|nr:amidohydrolase [Gammaproteobacteria bacterium]